MGNDLELAFKTKKIREICEDKDKAESALGTDAAGLLQAGISELLAAASVDELLTGNLGKLSDKPPTYGLDYEYGKIIFSPNHVKNPLLPNGLIDWPKVKYIQILKIEERT